MRPRDHLPLDTDCARRILVVDDAREIADLFRALEGRLARHGFRLEVETDPRRAMHRLREQRYALVVSDMRMPHADGLSVLQTARAFHPNGRRALMTGFASASGSPDRLAAAKPHAILSKPLRWAEIHRILLGLATPTRTHWPAPFPWRPKGPARGGPPHGSPA